MKGQLENMWDEFSPMKSRRSCTSLRLLQVLSSAGLRQQHGLAVGLKII